MKTRVTQIMPALLFLSFTLLILTWRGFLGSASGADAGVKTQLCMVIDGSGTISNTEWSIIVQAVAKAINDTIPHDGSVEFTIVQFGSSAGKTEIRPTVIYEGNYATIASEVLAIPKIGGGTPTADGLFRGWQELRNSSRFATAGKQVINLATDDWPGIRNDNATSDLDSSGGNADTRDDVIAVVNQAVSQGLDELDIEGIALPDPARDWYKNWAVRPQPGVIVPPFSKPGWIRIVADVPEFANTLGKKLQVIITGEDEVWVPSVEGAFAASIITIGMTSVVSAFSSAVNNPETFPSNLVAQKVNSLFPETLKKWLADFISSKRKLIIDRRIGSPFTLTRWEVVSYAVSLSVLTFAFSYAKAAGLIEILVVLPTVLATSIIVEFTKNFLIVVIARSQGVWTEHRLWYFGLATFLFSSLVFKVPFSSPSRITHNSPKFTRRSLGLVASSSVFIGLAFATLFYDLLANGFTLIGNIGLVMSLTMAFFETVPIPPMSGKDIYDWNKALWIALFTATFALYLLCLFLL